MAGAARSFSGLRDWSHYGTVFREWNGTMGCSKCWGGQFWEGESVRYASDLSILRGKYDGCMILGCGWYLKPTMASVLLSKNNLSLLVVVLQAEGERCWLHDQSKAKSAC